MEISRHRARVERLEDELDVVKENLKMARQDLEATYRSLDEITLDAASGKEPFPNLFDGAHRRVEVSTKNGEPNIDSPPLAAHYRENGENVIAHRPKRGTVKESHPSAS
jgi:hypothetical protein